MFDLKCQDCLDWLDSLEPESVHLAIADPPYNIGYNAYDKYQDQRETADYHGWCRGWVSRIYKALRPDGAFWLYINDENVSELDVAAKSIGFHKRSHVIHYYTFGVACAKNFARSHTHFLYYTKHKRRFTFNASESELRVPSARQIVYKDKRANPDGKLPDNTWVLSPIDFQKAFTPEEDVWLVSRVCGTFGERVERGTHGVKRGLPQMPELLVDRVEVRLDVVHSNPPAIGAARANRV